jgi:hypothetical protein
MIRKPLRRPLLARLRDYFGRVRGNPADAPVVERPVRLLPERIQVWEEYRYSFTAGPNPEYRPTPDKVAGDIQIDLPFDRLNDTARADAAAVLAVEPGAVAARYGALGFSRLERTDIPDRFFESESFSHYTLPLTVPLVRENEPHVVLRSERGDHERHHLYYTPKDPVPFPFTLDMAMSADGATLNDSTKPGILSNQQRVLHVALEFTMMRPHGVTEADVKVTLDVFLLFWCAPVAAHQFMLDGPADATLNVDARMNQVSVGGATVPFISTGRGPLRGRIEFRILVKDPIALQQANEVKGVFKLTGHGISMSAMRTEFFNAAGYVEPLSADGSPLVHYRSELYGNFTLPLETSTHAAPVALERHLTWFSPESAPDAYPTIRDLLIEENFTQEGALHPDPQGYQWTMVRQVDGKPLTLAIGLKRRDSMQLVELTDTDGQAGRKPAALQQMYYHDLTLTARYRGEWERLQTVIARIERRMRDRLHLRRKNEQTH